MIRVRESQRMDEIFLDIRGDDELEDIFPDKDFISIYDLRYELLRNYRILKKEYEEQYEEQYELME